MTCSTLLRSCLGVSCETPMIKSPVEIISCGVNAMAAEIFGFRSVFRSVCAGMTGSVNLDPSTESRTID